MNTAFDDGAYADGLEQYQMDRFSVGPGYANAMAKVYRNSEDPWDKGYVRGAELAK